MTVCSKCNTSMDDEMRFCPSCGTPVVSPEPEPVAPVADSSAEPPVFCPNCGEKNDSQFTFCQKCGSVLKVEAPAAVAPAPAPAVQPGTEKPATDVKGMFAALWAKLLAVWAKLPKKIVALVAGAAALVLVLVCVLNALGGKEKPAIVYLKDSEINFTYLNKVKPFEATSQLLDGSGETSLQTMLWMVQFSEDGTRMFYPDKADGSGYALYYRDLKKDNTKSDAAVKLNSDLQNSYSISKDGKRVFYLKGSERYLWVQYTKDADKKDKIASEVEEFVVNEDGSVLLYVTEGALYRKEVGSKKDAVKIDNDVSDLRVSKDCSQVYYLKDGSLYWKNGDKESVKIDRDVSRLVSFADKGAAYYLKNAPEEIKLADYVTDDLKDSDAALTEPNITDYQTSVENDWWGTTTETDWDAYNAAKDTYSKKQARDRLRAQLANEKITLDKQSLYFFDGEKETLVSGDIAEFKADAGARALAVYTKYNRANVEKVNLSALSSLADIQKKVQAADSTSAEVYVALREKEAQLGTSNASGYRLNDSETKLYFLDDYSAEKEYGTLMEVDVSGNTPGSPVKVDDDVAQIQFRADSDNLLYFKDVKNSSGDLYEKGKVIATDVYMYSLTSLPKSKALVYLADYSSSSRTGTLTIHNGKAKKIADDVYTNFAVESEKAIAYLTDWSTEKNRGDAYLYNGSSKPVKIDTDVNALWGLKRCNMLF